MPHSAQASDRRAALVTALCFVVPAVLYVMTAARTVQGGDTGEFGNIGFLGGVAHPPGYPLYSLLVRLAAHLPFGAPFFRVSLVSVLCAAAAVAVLQRALFRLTGSLLGSAVAALAFAVSREQWLLGGVPEVFSLNALAGAALLWSAQRLVAAAAERSPREAFVLGLVGGLGLTNHLSLIWCAPLVVWPLVVLLQERRAVFLRSFGLMVLGGLLGLTPYLLLPVFARTAGPDAFVWGEVNTWTGFLNHVLRREYGTFRLTKSGGPTVVHLAPILAYLKDLPRAYTYVFFIIGTLGIMEAIRYRWRWAVPVALSFVLAGGFFLSLFNIEVDAFGLAIAERFFVLPNLLFAPFVAAGVAALEERARLVTRGLALLALIAGVVFTYPAVNWRKDTFIERYFTAAVEAAAPNATILEMGDTSFSAFRWVTRVARVRPDVQSFEFTLLNVDWYLRRFQQRFPDFHAPGGSRDKLGPALDAMRKSGPAYTTWWTGQRARAIRALQFIPDGFLFRVEPPGTPLPPAGEQEEKLLRAAQVIGDQPLEPIEQQNALVRLVAAQAWMDLARRFDEAGEVKEGQLCKARAFFWKPETGIGEELSSQQ